VLFALAHSFTAGVVTLIVFLAYTFLENHFLSPVVTARTVKINPLLVFVAVLVGADIGNWLGGSDVSPCCGTRLLPLPDRRGIPSPGVASVIGPGLG
jgi:hypothetical protein